MRLRDTSGQGTIELVGMLVIVAAIVTGIASTGMGSSLASDLGPPGPEPDRPAHDP